MTEILLVDSPAGARRLTSNYPGLLKEAKVVKERSTLSGFTNITRVFVSIDFSDPELAWLAVQAMSHVEGSDGYAIYLGDPADMLARDIWGRVLFPFE